MIAKNIDLIIRYLCSSSLQFSLQSYQLSVNGAKPKRLHSSLQMQLFLQTVCKEKVLQYQSFTRLPFAALFAKNLN
jgi:hypothetical protein